MTRAFHDALPAPRFRAALAALLLLAASLNPASGRAADDPFVARVPVAYDSAATRDKALREALAQVLERVVGRPDPAFSSLLSNASRWAQQYGVVADEGETGLALSARFDDQAVQDALKARGLPVFGIDASLIEGWVLSIAGLRAAGDYSRVLDHLGSMRGVSRVDVEELREGMLRLRLTVEGGVAGVSEQVDRGNVLRKDGEGFYVFLGS